MYCIIKSVVHIGDMTEANGLPKRYAYITGTKNTARDYLKKIYQRDLERVSKNENCKILGYGNGDNLHASIEYIDKSLSGDAEYQHTYIGYYVVEGHEIVKLSDEKFMK